GSARRGEPSQALARAQAPQPSPWLVRETDAASSDVPPLCGRILPSMSKQAPVIAIDGPSASGKGTIASRVAKRLGFHYLESGALYRLVALLSLRESTLQADRLVALADEMDVLFAEGDILLGDEAVTEKVRSEPVGNRAAQAA